jgi:pyrophosphatase PpaX
MLQDLGGRALVSSRGSAYAMLDSVDAILFDLDGTLVDTIPLIFACYEHTLGVHLPGYHPGREAIVRNLGRSLDLILRDFAADAGTMDPAGRAALMLDTYRGFQRRNLARLIRPYDGMREALQALQARGLTLGLVTSKVEWAARECLDCYDLGRFLSVFVFHDDTVRHKPDPEPLLVAARKGNLAPARTLYVGDSIHDMAAGCAAGMRTVAALWGPSRREALIQAGAHALAGQPADLLAVVCP